MQDVITKYVYLNVTMETHATPISRYSTLQVINTTQGSRDCSGCYSNTTDGIILNRLITIYYYSDRHGW